MGQITCFIKRNLGKRTESRIMMALVSGPMASDQLYARTRMRRSDYFMELRCLVDTGAILREGSDQKGDPYVYRLSQRYRNSLSGKNVIILGDSEPRPRVTILPLDDSRHPWEILLKMRNSGGAMENGNSSSGNSVKTLPPKPPRKKKQLIVELEKRKARPKRDLVKIRRPKPDLTRPGKESS